MHTGEADLVSLPDAATTGKVRSYTKDEQAVV